MYNFSRIYFLIIFQPGTFLKNVIIQKNVFLNNFTAVLSLEKIEINIQN